MLLQRLGVIDIILILIYFLYQKNVVTNSYTLVDKSLVLKGSEKSNIIIKLLFQS
jgi:hypothetical protein